MKNLNEVSEIIENNIIDGFAKTYTSTELKQRIYNSISKPSILHGLSEIDVYIPQKQYNNEVFDNRINMEKELIINNIKKEQMRKNKNNSSVKKNDEINVDEINADEINADEINDSEINDGESINSIITNPNPSDNSSNEDSLELGRRNI
tara:strand:- start:987 stop:1436 length:450 start_codon:yes stop_codon:yes gene_type:complete